MGQMDQFQRLELEEVHKSSPSKVGSRAQPNENPFDTPIEDMDGGLDALNGSDVAQDTSHAQFLSVHVKEFFLLVGQSESPSRRWANQCSVEGVEESTRDKEQQDFVTDAIVPVDNTGENPLAVLDSNITIDERNCLVKKNMIEIARILRIGVEGRIKVIRTCIHRMLAEEAGHKVGNVCSKSKKSPRVVGSY